MQMTNIYYVLGAGAADQPSRLFQDRSLFIAVVMAFEVISTGPLVSFTEAWSQCNKELTFVATVIKHFLRQQWVTTD